MGYDRQRRRRYSAPVRMSPNCFDPCTSRQGAIKNETTSGSVCPAEPHHGVRRCLQRFLLRACHEEASPSSPYRRKLRVGTRTCSMPPFIREGQVVQ